MTQHRFLVPLLPSHGTVELPSSEAHHASRVLRCSTGEVIVLFDGLGNEASATIQSIDKRNVIATIEIAGSAEERHANMKTGGYV